MKKTFLLSSAFLILAGCILPVSGQHRIIPDPVRTEGIISVKEIAPAIRSSHPVALRAASRGEKPGEFTGVSYKYKGNVKALSPAEKNQMMMKQDGILDVSGKNIFIPHPDTIYVDPASDLVFQTESLNENQMMILRPGLSAVFEDIDIPQQEVRLTLANTVSLVEGAVAASTGKNEQYAVNLQFDSVSFMLDSVSDGSLSATLKGQIILTNPRVEGKYSKNGGYRLVFKTTEQVDLKVYTTVRANKEIKTPLWGTEIKAGDLGKCEIGLFLLISMEGEVTFAFEINQGIDLSLGARGGTFWYIPTSLHNISEVNHWCEINYGVQAEMKAFGGMHCTANLKIKSYDALDVYVTGGMEGTVETDGNTLSADIGFRIKSGGKVVSKRFTLADKYYSLWKMQQPDYKGYSMIIHEACAYGDYVAGEIHTVSDNANVPGKKDTIPYNGMLTVMVKHPNNQSNAYTAQANEKGIFLVTGVDLKKGDQVMVRLPGVSSASSPVSATIPFKTINLYTADYYSGEASGCVAGARSEWAKLAGRQSQGQIPANVTGMLQSSPASALKGMLQPQQMAAKMTDFKNSLTVYKGPIEFVTDVTRSVQPVATQAGRSTITREPEKPRPNRGVVNNPLGMFNVGGMDFFPGQKVKARIEVEGFVVESDWIETEGLLVSAIEHDQLVFSAGVRNENIAAQNSFVIVSALRGTNSPSGHVRLLKGSDVPHGSITGIQAVPEFPDAKRAKLWFDKTVELKPLAGYPGSAIAETGQWNTVYEYSSPGDVINPAKNRKHPFEMVSYSYKDQNLGYSVFIDKCASCTSPVNMVNKIGGLKKGEGQLRQPVKAPAPVRAPVVSPKVNPGMVR